MQTTNESTLKCTTCAGSGYIYEPKLRDCRHCDGIGHIDGEKCDLCSGEGWENSDVQISCQRCVGTGRLQRR